MKITIRQLRRLIFEQIKDTVDIDVDTQQEEVPAPPELDAGWGDVEDQWSPHHDPSIIDKEVERERNIPPDIYGDADEGYYDEDDFVDDPFNPDSPYSLGINEGFWSPWSKKETQDQKTQKLRIKHGDKLDKLKKGMSWDDIEEKDPIDNIEASLDDMRKDLGYDSWNDEVSMPLSRDEKIEQLRRKLQNKKIKRSKMF